MPQRTRIAASIFIRLLRYEVYADEDEADAEPAAPVDSLFEEKAGEEGFRDEDGGRHGDGETHGGDGDELHKREEADGHGAGGDDDVPVAGDGGEGAAEGGGAEVVHLTVMAHA